MIRILKRKHFARWQVSEEKALRFAGRLFLDLSGESLVKALQSGVLMEVHCGQDH